MTQLVKKCLQCGRPGFDPWVGKIPWRRERLSTPVFWPGEFHGLYSPWAHKELDMTEWLSLSHTQAAVSSPEIALFLLLGSDIISRWKCLLCIFPTEESEDNEPRLKAWCLGKLQWYKVQVLGGHTSLDVADGKFPISGFFHCNEAVRIKWD